MNSGGENVAQEKVEEFFVSGASALPYYPLMSAVSVKSTRSKRRGKVIAFDRMTSSDTALSAILEVLHRVAEGSCVRIFTHSRLVSREFKQICAARGRDLHDPYWRAQALLERKSLSVELRMVRRAQNPAREVLDEFKVALREARRRKEW